MNLQEQTDRIKQMMNIQEQIPDSRFSPKVDHRGDNLDNISLDDTIDVVSAIIDGVPGLGNLASVIIDIGHTISYLIRLYFAKTDDEKIEYGTLALITLGATFIPVAGNSLPILARKSIGQIIRQTPDEYLALAKKLGLFNRVVFLKKKSEWRFRKLLVLAKIFGGELAEFLKYVPNKLMEIYNKIKEIPKLSPAANAILSLIKMVKDLANDAELAVKIVDGMGKPTL